MKRSIWAILFAVCLGTVTTMSGAAQADPDPALRGTGQYGMAGCGLGSMLIGTDPGFMQVFAATTNGSFGSQTFGISFGTSNCTDTGGGAVSASSFVEANREVLVKDISRGSGETIATLSTLAGCSDSMQVGQTLQANFTSIFPSAGVSDQQVSQNVLSVLRSESTLSCNKI